MTSARSLVHNRSIASASPFEAMARSVLGEDYDARAVAILAEETAREIAALPSLANDHFEALFGLSVDFREREPICCYLDPDLGDRRYVIPPAMDALEVEPNKAAAELGLSRALGVDIDVIERLWKLGDKGQENARKVAKWVRRKTDNWPDNGTEDHAERIEQLWMPWTARLVSTKPDPTREPDDTDEQWRRKLNAWANSRTYARLPQCRLLAEALWHSRVRFLAEARGGIVTGLHSDVLAVMSPQGELSLGERVVRDARGREIADIVLVDASITEQMVRTGADLFGSLAGHRLLNFIVLEAASRDALAKAGGLIRPDDLHIDGGMAGLCELLGMNPKSETREMLRSILRAGTCLHWRSEVMDKQGGGLWTWEETIGRGRRKGSLVITAGPPLRPGFAAELKKAGKPARARKLVPELRYAPPLLSVRRNEQGKVYTMGRRFVGELVKHADQLPDGVRIDNADWLKMADAAGLPLALVDRVVDGFESGDENSPALLKRSGDRYTLGDVHSAEREHIEQLGERVRKGRASGKRSARKRAKTGKT